MSKAKNIAKNTLFAFTGDNIAKVVSLLLMIFIARLLGDVDYGKFSFALSFTTLFVILVDMGTRTLMVRRISYNKKDSAKVLGNVLSFKILTSTLTYLAIVVIINILNYDETTRLAVYIAGFAMIFESFSTTMTSVFQAHERLEFPAYTKVFRVLIRFSITLPVLLMGYGIIAVLLAYFFVQIVNLAANLILYSRNIGKVSLQFKREFMKGMISESIPFALSGLFVVIYFRIDITMLSLMTNDASVGWYSAAYNLLDAFITIPIAFSAALLPVAVKYVKENRKKAVELYQRSVRYIGYFAYPIAFCGVVLARPIILLIYGQEYVTSIPTLQVLLWALIPLFTVYIMGVMMIALKKEKIALVVLLGNSVVNIVLNLILIPKYSLLGAALATIGAELFYFSTYYHLIRKYFTGLNLGKLHFKPFIASAVSAAMIYETGNLNLFVKIVVGTVTYLLMLYLLRAFNDEDKNLIRELIQSRRKTKD